MACGMVAGDHTNETTTNAMAASNVTEPAVAVAFSHLSAASA